MSLSPKIHGLSWLYYRPNYQWFAVSLTGVENTIVFMLKHNQTGQARTPFMYYSKQTINLSTTVYAQNQLSQHLIANR